MRVLVTGASGMLGGGVARALAARGDEVTVLQRGPSAPEVREHVHEVRGDVSDPAIVQAAVRGQDVVVHLAAKVNVVGPWEQFHRVNVIGTETVIAACRMLGVPRLVHVSSPSVAHTGSSLVGAGAGPAEPVSARGPYARSKAMAEQLALRADRADLAVLAIRPHVVWGPGDTQLVQRIVDRARTGRLPVIGSGAALIDSTYIDNAVDALVAATDRCGPGLHGEALVVSNGEPRPVAELLGGFVAAAGVSAPRRHLPVGLARAAGSAVESVWRLRGRLGQPGSETDPPLTRFVVEQMSTAHWFDQRRTREALDWTPRISLDEGFERLRRSFAESGPGRATG